MAIKFSVENKVGITVEGVLNNADGNEIEFDLKLTLKRLKEAEFLQVQKHLMEEAAKSGNHSAVAEKLIELTTNWSGPRDESDAPLAYTPTNLKTLLECYSGLELMIWQKYREKRGARAKNSQSLQAQ